MVTGNRMQECITPTQMNLIFNTRSFWRELASWTRIYFRSRYLGIGNVDEVFRRLYEVPDKFASGLSLIFGDKFSTDYTLLLKQHVIILSELISAQFEGNIDEVNRNVNLLYQNGYERAKYLGDFNPYWSAVEWRNLIDAYHYLTLVEANTFTVDDHRASIDVYERLVAHAHMAGDYYAQGLFNYMIYSPQNGGMLGQMPKPQKKRVNEDFCITYSQMNAIYAIRMFWFELTSWIRAYFIVIFEGRGDPALISERFDAIFNEYRVIFSPFLGNQVIDENMQLIRAYIDLIIALIYAQKDGNADEITRIIQQINQNIDDRAAFLASVKPDFDQNEWKTLLTNYTRYTYEEITAYLAGDHVKSLDAYSRLLALSQELGDFFAKEFLYNAGSRNESPASFHVTCH